MTQPVPSSEWLAGSVLVADPALADPNFKQSLVFLAQHDPDGAFGLVMNRPLGKRVGLNELIPDIDLPAMAVPLCFGGPVQNERLFLAVFHLTDDGRELTCRLDAEPGDLREAADDDQSWIRAFSGYSGWGKGQLENELAQHAWHVRDPEALLLDERLAPGLWSVYVSSDERWRDLLPFLPDDPCTN